MYGRWDELSCTLTALIHHMGPNRDEVNRSDSPLTTLLNTLTALSAVIDHYKVGQMRVVEGRLLGVGWMSFMEALVPEGISGLYCKILRT